MMLYELDDIERAALDRTVKVRPGEKVIKWYCADCECEHEASVLGGAIVREENSDEWKENS